MNSCVIWPGDFTFTSWSGERFIPTYLFVNILRCRIYTENLASNVAVPVFAKSDAQKVLQPKSFFLSTCIKGGQASISDLESKTSIEHVMKKIPKCINNFDLTPCFSNKTASSLVGAIDFHSSALHVLSITTHSKCNSRWLPLNKSVWMSGIVLYLLTLIMDLFTQAFTISEAYQLGAFSDMT